MEIFLLLDQSLDVRRDLSSLLLFHQNIHYGVVSIVKDKYLILAYSFKVTRSLCIAQYFRYHTRPSDACKVWRLKPPLPMQKSGQYWSI